MSGNNMHEKMYSDGKTIAPMLPEFPHLSKCKKCDKIFWVSDLKEIGTFEWGDLDSKWQNADNLEFLGIDDHFKALEAGIAKNKQEELFIRVRIWWAYNDRTRKRMKIFEDTNDELRWNDNANILLKLFNQSDINEKIMAAELNRNMGNYENCIEIFQSIENNGLDWIKKLLINECEQKNRWVIKLN